MNRHLIRLMHFFAIPFVVGVVLLHLLHPFLHFLEGGSLDAMLPMLDMMAVTVGGGSAIDWARRRRHKHDDHCEH